MSALKNTCLPVQPTGVQLSLTFTLRDAISVFGDWKVAKALTWADFMENALLTSFELMFTILPRPLWFDEAANPIVFRTTARVVVASPVAYLGSTYLNTLALERFKDRLFGRTLTSNLTSTSVDTVVFISFAYATMGAPLLIPVAGQVVFLWLHNSVLMPLLYWVRGRLTEQGLTLEGY